MRHFAEQSTKSPYSTPKGAKSACFCPQSTGITNIVACPNEKVREAFLVSGLQDKLASATQAALSSEQPASRRA